MPTPAQIAASLFTAPAWAKIGLVVPSERAWVNAVREIARRVHMSLYEALIVDEGQVVLPLEVRLIRSSANVMIAENFEPKILRPFPFK